MSGYCLIGVDGNAFAIMGYVTKSMRKEGMSEDKMKEFRKVAMSGDYNNLLSVSQDMVELLNEG